jgi:hypothetical protein
MWSACSVCYFLTNYYIARMPGETFWNYYASAGAEVLATALSGLIYSNLGVRKSFMLTYSITICGALSIALQGDSVPELMPAFVLVTKVGIYSAYMFTWIAPIGMFPTLF